jgi:hypothetical protein
VATFHASDLTALHLVGGSILEALTVVLHPYRLT